ncbi:biotin transporter BioY [Virgibacillus xinjiangensis]|uniref:Biotin transporter n=1 Tax=Virgibacillus xinjiangensis TaxID=393090 RepID=A0ABV7CWA7_9BACI
MKLRPLDITLAALFAALMAIGANIASFLVIGGVPITLTTFFSILSGLILGSRLGAISMTVYMLIGFAGAPVFSQFFGGPSVLIRPTFGFILSYILVAYVAGKIIERSATKTTYMAGAMIGLAVNYFIGTNWMYLAYQLWLEAPEKIGYALAWLWMLPPLPKDIIFSILAGGLAYRIRGTVYKPEKGKGRSIA